jgi:hypothetical protein
MIIELEREPANATPAALEEHYADRPPATTTVRSES